MSISATTRFANREVLEAVIVDYATKKPFENFDYANVATHEVTGEAVYAYGGKQHPKRVTFYGEKGGTLSFETQIQTMKLYQLAFGAEKKTSTEFIKREVLAATSADSNITFTTTAAPVTGTINIYPITDDCGTEVSTSFTVSGSTITVASDDKSKYTAGTSYIVYYMTAISDKPILSLNTNSFPKEVSIYGTTFEKTEESAILDYKMKVYKAAPQPNFTTSFSNNGDPATITITFDLLADSDGNMVDYILEEEAAS